MMQKLTGAGFIAPTEPAAELPTFAGAPQAVVTSSMPSVTVPGHAALTADQLKSIFPMGAPESYQEGQPAPVPEQLRAFMEQFMSGPAPAVTQVLTPAEVPPADRGSYAVIEESPVASDPVPDTFVAAAPVPEPAMELPPSGKSVLLVVTSAAKMGDHDTGLWSEECAGPYYFFKDRGCSVTVCSIDGGDVPIDAASLGESFKTANDSRMEAEGWAPLKGTAKLADQDVTSFDILFFAGGHGTCVDFHTEAVGRTIGSAASAGKVVAAVCHGPMALVHAEVAGKPLVQGKQVACFTNTEEEMVALTGKVPFLLEDKMKELGATVLPAEPWNDQAVRDGNLVTGQNPQSSISVAKLALQAASEAPAAPTAAASKKAKKSKKGVAKKIKGKGKRGICC